MPLPRRLREGVDPGAALLAAGAVALFSAAHGGFFPDAWRWGALALVAAGGLTLVLRGQVSLPRGSLALLAAIVALAGWTALSALWSSDPSASLLEAQRAGLYVAAAVALVLAAATAGGGDGLVAGVVAAVTGICVVALVGRAVFQPRFDPYEGTLLVGPLGYANALGALAAIAGVATGAAALRRHGRERALVALPLAALVPALALTNSRGAWVAGAAGVAFAAALVLGRRRVALAVLALSLAGLGAGLAAPRSVEHGLGDRPAYWSASRAAIGRHPALGVGAGGWARVWAAAAPTGHPAQDAHSLYLETLVELGPIGLALVLALLAAPLAVGLTATRPPAAALGGYLVFCLHAGVDWDWEMPAVTIAGLALGVAALGRSRRERRAG